MPSTDTVVDVPTMGARRGFAATVRQADGVRHSIPSFCNFSTFLKYVVGSSMHLIGRSSPAAASDSFELLLSWKSPAAR